MTSSTSPALRQVGAALRTFLALTVVLGLVYPLAMTGIAQVVFPDNADGSLVESSDGAVGSELIGQAFTRPVMKNGEPVMDADGVPVTVPDPAYFQSRPSAAGTGYDPLSTSASNYGPENPDLVALVEERRAAVAELDGLDGAQVSPDALLASGSGLDPHISPTYAEQQVARVAEGRGLEPDQVRKLVDEHTQGRALGFLGEPHVNVLMLNMALDRLTGAPDEADSQ
ncbi:MAG: potassium-transporting ATPase subunit C [Nocardioidaceae bacterium]